jgi:hypothetical protein
MLNYNELKLGVARQFLVKPVPQLKDSRDDSRDNYIVHNEESRDNHIHVQKCLAFHFFINRGV